MSTSLRAWKIARGHSWGEIAKMCADIGVEVSDEHLRRLACSEQPARKVAVDVVLALVAVSKGDVSFAWFVQAAPELQAKLRKVGIMVSRGGFKIPAFRPLTGQE